MGAGLEKSMGFHRLVSGKFQTCPRLPRDVSVKFRGSCGRLGEVVDVSGKSRGSSCNGIWPLAVMQCPCVRLCVCLSRSYILSKRVTIILNFFSLSGIAKPIYTVFQKTCDHVFDDKLK